MSAVEAAVKASLPPMESAAPMGTQLEPAGALHEANRKIAAIVLQLAEFIPVVARANEESKRRALLKAVDMLSGEFPPDTDTKPDSSVNQAVTAANQPPPAPGQATQPPAAGAPPEAMAAQAAAAGAS